MKRVTSKLAILKWAILFIMLFCFISVAVPAFSAEKAIAKLTSYSGTVLLKSHGDWGVKPEKDLPLYSDDKVVTKAGIATITFDDGAVMDLKANSNLLIRETEEGGVGGGVAAAKRQLRLLLGKMMFRSGKGTNVNTTLETTTLVCGLRGTAGTLSIDAAGQSYIQFTEGGGDTVGNFISGVASDVPSELANLNPAQKAAFVAAAAADQAAQASAKLATGEVKDADAALAGAQAAEAAAQEAKAAAETMLSNPDATIRTEAAAAITAADAAIEAAKAVEQQAIDAGAAAVPVTGPTTTETTTTSETVGFDVKPIATTQGNETDILIGDTIPPVVTPMTGPNPITNSNSASFTFSADEDVTYYYQLDGGSKVKVGQSLKDEVSVVDLSGLSEGSHSIVLIAEDSYKNAATYDYAWTTDYTAPVVALSAAPNTEGTATITAYYTNSEPGTVSVVINSDIAGPAVGQHTISVTATDQVGNTSTQEFNFFLENIALEGIVAGTGSVITGKATGTASVIKDDNWGGWKTDMDGTWTGETHSGTLSLAAGDAGSMNVWLSVISGTINTTTGAATGTTDLTMLTPTTLTTGTGSFSGSFLSDGTWTGTETGSGLTNKPLAFISTFGADVSSATRYYIGEYDYETGDVYSYYEYEYSEDKSYGYVYFYSDDGAGGLPYYKIYFNANGTYDKYDYDSGTTVYSSGSWSDLGIDDLSDLAEAPTEYGDNYYVYNYEFVGLGEPSVYLEGALAGTESLWGTAAKTTGVPVIAIGGVYANEYNYSLDSSLWMSGLYSENYLEETATTYDDGAYFAFLGGIKSNDILKAGFIGLGVSPDGAAGYLMGDDLSGYIYDNDMFKMEGTLTWSPQETISGVTAANLADNIYLGYDGGMVLAGELGTNGTITGGNNGFYWYDYFDSGDFETASIVDYTNQVAAPWGIYAGYSTGEFENTDSAAAWTSYTGGYGVFGAYFDEDNYDNGDYGYWVGETSGAWADGIITGDLSGRFLSLTKMGDISGDILGTYNSTTGTWEAGSFGTWEGDPLKFVSHIEAGIYHGAKYFDGKYDYEGGGYYYYRYYEDNSYGYIYDCPSSSSDGYPYTRTYYYGDGSKETYYYTAYDEYTYTLTYDAWDPDTQDLADLVDDPSETYDYSYAYDYVGSRVSGYIDGLMGGTTSLWSGSDIPVTFLGEYYDFSAYYNNYYGYDVSDSSGVWYNDNIYSYNYINDTCTTYDDGAYYGYIGGISKYIGYNDNDLEGRFVALYIDPYGNAGYLKGSLAGTLYTETGLFEMDGTINRTQMASASDLGIAAGDLLKMDEDGNYTNISYGYGYAALTGKVGDTGYITTDGNGGYGASAVADGNSYSGYLQTMSIADQDWGIYLIDGLYGEFDYGDSAATTWTYNMGGMFNSNDGYFLGAANSGTWVDGELSALFNGRFLTTDKMGTISGDILGTYNEDTGIWEAVSIGTWEGEELDLSAEWEGRLSSYDAGKIGETYGLVGMVYDEAQGYYDYLAMGDYESDSAYSGPYLFSSEIGEYDNDNWKTYAMSGGVAKDNLITGMMAGVYNNEDDKTSGVFFTDISGAFYELSSDEDSSYGMWIMEGTVTPVVIASGLDDTYDVVQETASPNFINADSEPNISVTDEEDNDNGEVLINTIMKDDKVTQEFGVIGTILNGAYSVLPTTGWSLSLVDKSSDGLYETAWMEIGSGAEASQWADGELSADVSGAWVDLGYYMTGVMGGKLIGTFDANDTKWQALALGSIIDTKTFLAMAATDEGKAKLAQLNIPCIEVGSTNLTGSGDNLASVAMNDVKFFAYSTGASPKIWATGDVSGTTTGSSPVNSTATLSGTGFVDSVSFTVNSYGSAGGNWDATVSGSGTVSTHDVDIKGGAAGTVGTDVTTFSGTGAGVAKPK